MRVHTAADIQAILSVYEQSEDFLSLGPVPKASMKMVSADIEHSTRSGGVFCVIENHDGSQVGVLDFVPQYSTHTCFLSLLMIARDHRGKGYGQAIIQALESYLRRNYKTHSIESGVQTNNSRGMGFWRKCGFDIGNIARALDDRTVAYSMRKEIKQTT